MLISEKDFITYDNKPYNGFDRIVCCFFICSDSVEGNTKEIIKMKYFALIKIPHL